MRVKIKPYLQHQSEFSHYFATWAVNHRGWCKMKKLNRKLAKKRMRREIQKRMEEMKEK